MANEPENMNGGAASGEGAQDKPKKKNIIRLFRPQNSKTGMVKAGERPGAHKQHSAKPAAESAAKTAAVKPEASEAAKKAEQAPAKAPAAEVKAPAAQTAPAKAPAAEVKAPAAAPAKETQPSAKAETAAPAQTENRPAAQDRQRDGQQRTGGYNRDGQQRSGGYNRDGQQRSGGYNRDGQQRTGGYNRDGQQRSGGYNRDGQQRTGGYNRDGQQRTGGYNRDGQQRTGGYNRDGQQRTGGYNRDGQQRSGGYNRDGQQRTGGYNRDGQQRTGSYNRDGQRPAGGFNRDGQRPAGGFNRDGQGRAPFNKDGAQGGDRRPFAGRPGAGRPAAEPKPMEKEGRLRNERGRADHKKTGAEKGDKFDRLEKSAQSKSNSRGKKPVQAKPAAPVVEEKIKSITIPEKLSLKDLADAMKIVPAQIIKKLFMQGKMVTMNDILTYEEAEEIALEYEILCEKEIKIDPTEELLKDTEDPEDTLVSRPPVVCVMGHVDHGKTSLLDAIRDTHVTARESGGITQAIGASVVEINDQKITFLDTPGHEAFTAMRMRGAKSTDIAVLVVAADDGVMPQTIEAINHAKAAGIEIIVAINKVDKPSANVERVKQELTEYELIPEDWGGSTVFCEVSAKTHQGIDNLLEMILLTSEVLELKANPNRRARALVIEAKLDKGRGPVATVLVQKGTLHVGDPVAAGCFFGKVRAMVDDKHQNVKEAGPATPVEIIGLNGVPNAGEVLLVPESDKDARAFAETFITEGREKMLEETRQRVSLEDMYSQIQAGKLKNLELIVKADVQGSVEAIKQSLLKLSNEEVVVKIIHSGVGAINESDVILASASNAIIIGFNVRPDAVAKNTADHEGVDLRLYKVIYDIINDVESAMTGMLEPIYEEKVIGHAEIRQLFKASGVGTIAGSYILDGVFKRGCKARITRDGKQIFDGQLASLKRFKDDVKEVKAGYECGLVFEKFNDLAEGDQVEAYDMVEVPRKK